MSRPAEAGYPCPGGCGETVFPWTSYCHECQGYLDELGKVPAKSPAPISKLPDTRSEKQIQAAIVKVLRTAGYSVWDTSQPHAAKITPGLPDLLVLGHGRLLFVEVKRADGKLTEAQRSFAHHCEATGTEHRVWRSEADALAWMGRMEEDR